MDIVITDELPAIADYQSLRGETDWPSVADREVERGFRGTLLAACARTADGQLAGFGRIVGDGALYFYVQDVIVRRDLRGANVGTRLVEHLVAQVRASAPQAFVGLMAAAGSVAFYERLGFARRPDDRPGMFLR